MQIGVSDFVNFYEILCLQKVYLNTDDMEHRDNNRMTITLLVVCGNEYIGWEL